MQSDGKPKRKRSMTSIALQWVNERIQKAELLKQRVKSGAYTVSSEELAKSLVASQKQSG